MNYFQNLFRDEAIEFRQTLKKNNTKVVLQAICKEYAGDDPTEVSKFKFDEIKYDPASESFADFLTKFKKTARQAVGDKAPDITETILFAK